MRWPLPRRRLLETTGSVSCALMAGMLSPAADGFWNPLSRTGSTHKSRTTRPHFLETWWCKEGDSSGVEDGCQDRKGPISPVRLGAVRHSIASNRRFRVMRESRVSTTTQCHFCERSCSVTEPALSFEDFCERLLSLFNEGWLTQPTSTRR